MKQKRWRTEQVALETGLSVRTVQSMARRGDIPGAARLGHQWTFDVVKLQRWIKQGEIGNCPILSTYDYEAKSGTHGSRSTGIRTNEAYEQIINLRPNAA